MSRIAGSAATANAWSGRSNAISGLRPVALRGKVRGGLAALRVKVWVVRRQAVVPERAFRPGQHPIDELRVRMRTRSRGKTLTACHRSKTHGSRTHGRILP